MNTNKLTQKSIEVIQNAQSIAVSNSNQQIDQLHILLALLSQQDGLIPQLLSKMGVDDNAVREETERCVDGLPKVTGSGRRPDEVYITPDTDKALTAAEEEAKQERRHPVLGRGAHHPTLPVALSHLVLEYDALV